MFHNSFCPRLHDIAYWLQFRARPNPVQLFFPQPTNLSSDWTQSISHFPITLLRILLTLRRRRTNASRCASPPRGEGVPPTRPPRRPPRRPLFHGIPEEGKGKWIGLFCSFMTACSVCRFTGSSKINGAKFSDACSVRANWLCMSWSFCLAEMRWEFQTGGKFFCTTLYTQHDLPLTGYMGRYNNTGQF